MPPTGSLILIEKATNKCPRCLLPPQTLPHFSAEAIASPTDPSTETQLLGTSKYPQWNPRGVFCLLVKHHGASRTPQSRLFSKAAVLTELTRSRWLWAVNPASIEDPGLARVAALESVTFPNDRGSL